MIDLEFLTTDPDEIELCRRYWQLDGDGKFKECENALPAYSRRGKELALVLLLGVIPRDSRRRCSTCGTPGVVADRESYLTPVTKLSPCNSCLYSKTHLDRCRRLRRNERLDDHGSDIEFKFPVAAIALLHALCHKIHPDALRDGFSVHDCEGLAPAHLHRFLDRLCAAQIIKKSAPSKTGSNGLAARTYRLTGNPALAQDIGAFNRLLVAGRSFDHQGLVELWLDYAVAECVAFICGQSALLNLPIDPNDEELCAALRTAMNTYSIGEVWSVSRFAVQEASALVEHGYSPREAVASLSGRITWRCNASRVGLPMPEPVTRTATHDPRTSLGDWFDDWYGVFEHIRGAVVAELFRASCNTRTPLESVLEHPHQHEAAHAPGAGTKLDCSERC